MGKRRVGARFFGVGVRALHGTMANHNHRHFARAAGIRPPAEPPALLACPVRGGREPGLGEEEKMGADYFIVTRGNRGEVDYFAHSSVVPASARIAQARSLVTKTAS